MAFHRVLSVVLVPVCWLLVAADPSPPVPGTVGNSSRANATHGGDKVPGGRNITLNVDSSMIQRALYVLIGTTVIGVLYFLIRAVRLKRPSQRKKYGLLSNYDDSVEMEAVESDEDDTLYEARSLHR